MEIIGINLPTVGHHIQFKRLDTGNLTLNFGQEVNWESDTLVSVDVADINKHLWDDSKIGLVVRFTNETYEPVSAWSSGLFFAVDSSACGIERPTPTPTPTVANPDGQATIEVTIPPEGGVISGSVGLSTTVTFPAGVYSETLTVTLQPVATPPATGGLRLLGLVLSITAVDGQGNPVTHFDQDITIVIEYEQSAVEGMIEDDLVLHYWNVAEGRWVLLPTRVDKDANTLTIHLDHLTNFAVLEVPQTRIYLPSLLR